MGPKISLVIKKSVAHPWTSVWRVVPMILSSVLQAEIKFHTDYHGGARMDLLRAFLSEKRNLWLIRGHPCEALSPWFSVVCFKLRLISHGLSRMSHGWICYELFCLKRENLDSSVDIRVKSVSMILSSVLQPEIMFHTDYHGLCHGWFWYELFCLKREIRGSSVDIRVKSCLHDSQ